MHELGIVFHIIDSLEKIGKENQVSKINRVTLQLGEVSGVVDSYLTDCWRWAAKKSLLLENAELEIEPIRAVTVCEDCGETYATLQYAKICPKCGSEKTHLVTGNEINIKEIECADNE